MYQGERVLKRLPRVSVSMLVAGSKILVILAQSNNRELAFYPRKCLLLMSQNKQIN